MDATLPYMDAMLLLMDSMLPRSRTAAGSSSRCYGMRCTELEYSAMGCGVRSSGIVLWNVCTELCYGPRRTSQPSNAKAPL
eukprot:881807-Rhodomonas_salina.1